MLPALAARLEQPAGDDGLGDHADLVRRSSAPHRPAVTATTTGKIRRVMSGPPVALSSSAASYKASIAARTVVARSAPGSYRFFRADLANIEPDPTE